MSDGHFLLPMFCISQNCHVWPSLRNRDRKELEQEGELRLEMMSISRSVWGNQNICLLDAWVIHGHTGCIKVPYACGLTGLTKTPTQCMKESRAECPILTSHEQLVGRGRAKPGFHPSLLHGLEKGSKEHIMSGNGPLQNTSLLSTSHKQVLWAL